MHPDLWKVVRYGRWTQAEHITVLEARALHRTVRRLCLFEKGRNLKQLCLVDNLGVALSYDRFRAKDFRLLTNLRKTAGYLLARNNRLSVRWIPSEKNSADPPSRAFEDNSTFLKRLQFTKPAF